MRRVLFPLFSALLFGAAVLLLHRELATVHLAEVMGRLHGVSPNTLFYACGFTALSYATLTGYDYLALRHIGRVLPYPRIALISFVANAVAHNVGASVLSGGAVRLRMYGAAGLSAVEVGTVVALCLATFAISVTTLIGVVFLMDPAGVALLLPVSGGLARGAGALLLWLIGGYLVWAGLRRAPIRIGPWQLSPPGAGVTAAQIGIGVADLSLACATLFVLLPADAHLSFPGFLAIYVLAMAAAAVSHVPAGLGVFEAVMILGLPGVPKDALVAMILGYRGVYYLVPLGIALLLAVGHEVTVRRHRLRGELGLIQGVWEAITPQLTAIAVFLVGALLLLSGSIPALAGRMRRLHDLVPLPLLEISHLTASLTGLALLILARGLSRRVKEAYRITLMLLLVGAVAAIGRGLDWEQAILLCLVAGALYSGREAFSRPASLLNQAFTPGWVAAIIVTVVGTIWLGLFAYKHVDYSDMLWWQFAFHGEAPRFLRSTLAVVVLGTALGLWRLMRPAPPAPQPIDTGQLDRAAAIIATASASYAALALLGDKRLLFNDTGDGFIMYQVQGRSWIAMGDPIAPAHRVEELAWRFRELCDRHGGKPVFYEVGIRHLPVYLDQGLAPLKIGEEALVPLENFSLAGSDRAEFRQAQRRGERAGARFSVVPAGEVRTHLADMRAVSEAWMVAKSTREKGFSVGRFEPEYLCRFPCALVHVEGRLVAFTNLWVTGDRSELAADLMRYSPDAPKGIMDYLFAELLLWGAAEGYARFSLGMAPLSGMENHPLAPMWHRIGMTIFLAGEYFYNFEGLRAYKEKFHPEWRPKYLVAPRGLALPAVLVDLTALIGGGMKGVLMK